MTDERLRKDLETVHPSNFNTDEGIRVGSSEQLEEAVSRLKEEGKTPLPIFTQDGIRVNTVPDEIKQAMERIAREMAKRSNSPNN